MKLSKFFYTYILVSVSLLLFGNVALAQDTQNFTIENFKAVYSLSKTPRGSAQLVVDEYITAQFPNYDQNHGIIRALPKSYNKQDLRLKIDKVDKSSFQESNPSSWNYKTSTENKNLVVKIGDGSRFLHGVHNFHISYRMQNVLNYDDSNTFKELYWNVNGNQWRQTFKQTEATINMPLDIGDGITNLACYTGGYGSKAKDCTISKNKVGNSMRVEVSANKALLAGENLSFVIGFKADTFQIVQPTFWEKYGATIINSLFVVGIPALAAGYVISRWLKYGRDPKTNRSVVAQYKPPKDSSLLVNDYVLNEKSRPLAISAQVLELAIRGYIRIIDNTKKGLLGKKKNFSLEVTKAPDNNLATEETSVLNMFFDSNPKVGAVADLSKLKQKLSHQTIELAKEIALKATDTQFFVSNPEKLIKKYRLWGAILTIAGAVAFVAISAGPLSGVVAKPLIGIGIFISGLILLWSAKIMPAKSLKGAELRNYMLGLKLYIGMAEQERIRFHDSPDNAQRERVNANNSKQMVKIFEQLLPYAMLFGMEKGWGKQFEKIYQQQPDWYSGSWTTFNASYLASGLHDFNSVSSMTFSPPPSSSGSGFGGGGFSGGGGGGGGGGGW
ncbi:DUF2207 domain-containing protein [Candidatus Saccharibacteria bacterium]|jgi:uncharacterized membrane protein|nr:DUF2207 domain-containing protein [Candidatus Saccharibacteria bacterium]HOR23178.1 DUF2207 domain-containing protein [Candidatus Saccharibacteria bacterium]